MSLFDKLRDAFGIRRAQKCSTRQPRLFFECLEDRMALSNLNSPLFDNGIIGRDPATGNWSAIRFDGSLNVSEPLVTNGDSPPNWQLSLIGDIDGDHRADI